MFRNKAFFCKMCMLYTIKIYTELCTPLTSFLLNRLLFSSTEALFHYLQYVSHLGFETKPDYKYCKRLFSQAIYDAGYNNDGKLSFDGNIAKRVVKKAKKVSYIKNIYKTL